MAKLASHGRTPEEATEHFLTHLGNEAVRLAKPLIRVLAEDWPVISQYRVASLNSMSLGRC